MGSECCGICAIASFLTIGVVAQAVISIWLLIESIRALFYDDAAKGQCPDKVVGFVWFIFVSCILKMIETGNRINESDKDKETDPMAAMACYGVFMLIMGFVCQFEFWNLCDDKLNDTVAIYMYLAYGVAAWTLALNVMSMLETFCASSKGPKDPRDPNDLEDALEETTI